MLQNPTQPGSKPANADFSNEPNHAFACFNFQQKKQDARYDNADNEKDKRRTKTHTDHIFPHLVNIWGSISGLSSFGRLHDDWCGGFSCPKFCFHMGKNSSICPGLAHAARSKGELLPHSLDRKRASSVLQAKKPLFRPVIKDVVERYLDCDNPRFGFARILARIRCGFFAGGQRNEVAKLK